MNLSEKTSLVNPVRSPKLSFRQKIHFLASNGVKDKIRPYGNDIILVSTLIFTGLICFGLGRLSVVYESKEPVKIENTAVLANVSEAGKGTTENLQNSSAQAAAEDALYVASKNGTKCHFPWCSGAQSIKEENKVWFKTKEEAEKAGYSPASNCKGL